MSLKIWSRKLVGVVMGDTEEEETEVPMSSVIEHHSDKVKENPRGREMGDDTKGKIVSINLT